MGNILVDHPNMAEAAVIGKQHAVPLWLLEVRKRGVLQMTYVPCADMPKITPVPYQTLVRIFEKDGFQL